MRPLLIATRSKGKFPEIVSILDGSEYKLLSLNDLDSVPEDFEVEEPAMTFEGNAIIKAMTIGMLSGELTAAEDSGLVVDALGGRPGVHSARYAVGTDMDRCRKLLGELMDVPEEKRTASFVAVVALFDPSTNTVRTCEGRTHGSIAREPVGEQGFGYDPIFRFDATGETGAQMTKEEKNEVSHRGAAWKAARALLTREFL